MGNIKTLMNDGKPLAPPEAKRLAITILENGTVTIDPAHATPRMSERSVTMQDIENTLRGGVCQPAEWSDRFAEWRYRFETSRFGVVITFEDEENALVVTVWRRK